MKAVIGLGNPGPRYARTRHNAGFWLIDCLAEQLAVSVQRQKGNSLNAIATVDGTRLLLAKPQTYMNESGVAVQGLARRYGLKPDEILICYDDLAIDCGQLRLRAKGGAGGHNGVRSIIQYVGTRDFPRLRLGIGAVPPGVSGVDYVLGKPPPDERALLEDAVSKGTEAVLLWAERGIDFAMSRANTSR